MKATYRVLFVTVIIIAALSLLINVLMFQMGIGFYQQIGELTLDPLGLNSAFPPEKSVSTDTVVLFYGDSRAAVWPPPTTSDNYIFINLGVGAQSTVQASLRFPYHVAPLQPDIIVMQVGINNLKFIPIFPTRKQTIIDQSKANIQQLVEAARDNGARVILTTIFPVGDAPLHRQPFWSDDVRLAVNEVNEYIGTLADENVTIFDAFELLVAENGKVRDEYSEDELHISPAGYERLNKALIPVLESVFSEES